MSQVWRGCWVSSHRKTVKEGKVTSEDPEMKDRDLRWECVSLNMCTVSIVLSFPECPRVGIIQNVTFFHWLLSLSDMHLLFLPVFS